MLGSWQWLLWLALHVAGRPDACPTPDALAGALRRALPGARILLSGHGPGGAGPHRELPVRLTELHGPGGRYRVEVLGGAREFSDPARRCEERARVAAVFIALAVDPPKPPSLPSPPPLGPAQDRPGPRAPRPTPIDLDVEGGAALLLTPRGGRSESALLSLGLDLRAVLCKGLLCGSFGVAGLPVAPLTLGLTIPGASASLLRLPLDLSARARLRRGPIEVGVELGGVLAVLWVEGQDLPGPAAPRDVRVEPGLRVRGLLRAGVHPRLALLLGLEAQVVPAPYALVIEAAGGQQVLGRTPAAWFGVQAGVAARASLQRSGGRF